MEINGDNVVIVVDITSSAPEVKAQITDDATKELQKLGFKGVEVHITAPQAPKQMSNSVSGKNIAPHVKSFVMVSSGKGGVGKSTTSVNLAIAMAMQGKKVGLLDADIYGPNIPRMMGVANQRPEIQGNKVIPLKAYGVEIMSMGSLMEEGQSLIWRGSMIMKAIEQFLRDILWSELDVLVIDMPPGTGDAQVTLAQSCSSYGRNYSYNPQGSGALNREKPSDSKVLGLGIKFIGSLHGGGPFFRGKNSKGPSLGNPFSGGENWGVGTKKQPGVQRGFWFCAGAKRGANLFSEGKRGVHREGGVPNNGGCSCKAGLWGTLLKFCGGKKIVGRIV